MFHASIAAVAGTILFASSMAAPVPTCVQSNPPNSTFEPACVRIDPLVQRPRKFVVKLEGANSKSNLLVLDEKDAAQILNLHKPYEQAKAERSYGFQHPIYRGEKIKFSHPIWDGSKPPLILINNTRQSEAKTRVLGTCIKGAQQSSHEKK